MGATDATRSSMGVATGRISLDADTSATVTRQRGRRYFIRSGRWLQAAYVCIDIFFVTCDAFIASAIRYDSWFGIAALMHTIHLQGFRAIDQPSKFYLSFLLLYVGLIVICCQGQQLYRTLRERNSTDEAVAVAKAVGWATLLLTAFVYLSGAKSVSRLIVITSGLLNIVTLSSWRLLRRHIVRQRVINGIGARNVLIVGAGRVGRALANFLERNPHLGYIVKGFLDEAPSTDPRVLGSMKDLPRLARSQFADEIFVTIPQHRATVKRVAAEAIRLNLAVNVIPELFDGMGPHTHIHQLGDFPVMELYRQPTSEFGFFAKRLFDIVISTACMVLVAPFLALLAIAIRLDSPGPPFYSASRVGKRGRLFKCYKLRTMVQDADRQKEKLRHLNERSGPFFKISDDPRVTPIGRWLRRYSLDELPQLWNVIKGDMSLVGPRPHPIDDYKQYDLDHLRRLDVRPGLTGLWQITARREPSFEKSMALDIQYIEDRNFWFDVKILFKTVPEILRASGI